MTIFQDTVFGHPLQTFMTFSCIIVCYSFGGAIDSFPTDCIKHFHFAILIFMLDKFNITKFSCFRYEYKQTKLLNRISDNTYKQPNRDKR